MNTIRIILNIASLTALCVIGILAAMDDNSKWYMHTINLLLVVYTITHRPYNVKTK